MAANGKTRRDDKHTKSLMVGRLSAFSSPLSLPFVPFSLSLYYKVLYYIQGAVEWPLLLYVSSAYHGLEVAARSTFITSK